MAGKTNGPGPAGVGTFIQTRHPNNNGQQPGVSPELFKDMVVQTKVSKPGKRSRNQASHAAPDDKDNRRSKQRPTEDHDHFYDTDASAADDTSTTFSVKNADYGQPPESHQRVIDDRQHHQIEAASEYEEDELDEDAHDPSAAIFRQYNDLTNAQLALDSRRRQERMPEQKLSIQRPMPGEEYPTTTSGRSSPDLVAEPQFDTNVQHRQTGPDMQTQRVVYQMLPPPPTKKAAQPQQKLPVIEIAPARRTEGMKSNAQGGYISRPAEPKLDAQFAYTAAQKTAPTVQRPEKREVPHGASTNPVQNASIAAATKGTAQMHPNGHVFAKSMTNNDHDAFKAQQEHPAPTNLRQRLEYRPAPQGKPVSNIKYEQFTQEQTRVDNEMPSSEQDDEPEAKNLDYEEVELFSMQYADLKKQSFDTDPRGTTFDMPDKFEQSTLENKMEIVAKMAQGDQGKFFTSLSLDDWEQAGDWFITRFSGILDIYKETRREKRKAAKELETEIESRHDIVGKKRKQIDDSLTEMKTSGDKVLQATPKRAKKS